MPWEPQRLQSRIVPTPLTSQHASSTSATQSSTIEVTPPSPTVVPTSGAITCPSEGLLPLPNGLACAGVNGSDATQMTPELLVLNADVVDGITSTPISVPSVVTLVTFPEVLSTPLLVSNSIPSANSTINALLSIAASTVTQVLSIQTSPPSLSASQTQTSTTSFSSSSSSTQSSTAAYSSVTVSIDSAVEEPATFSTDPASASGSSDNSSGTNVNAQTTTSTQAIADGTITITSSPLTLPSSTFSISKINGVALSSALGSSESAPSSPTGSSTGDEFSSSPQTSQQRLSQMTHRIVVPVVVAVVGSILLFCILFRFIRRRRRRRKAGERDDGYWAEDEESCIGPIFSKLKLWKSLDARPRCFSTSSSFFSGGIRDHDGLGLLAAISNVTSERPLLNSPSVDFNHRYNTKDGTHASPGSLLIIPSAPAITYPNPIARRYTMNEPPVSSSASSFPLLVDDRNWPESSQSIESWTTYDTATTSTEKPKDIEGSSPLQSPIAKSPRNSQSFIPSYYFGGLTTTRNKTYSSSIIPAESRVSSEPTSTAYSQSTGPYAI